MAIQKNTSTATKLLSLFCFIVFVGMTTHDSHTETRQRFCGERNCTWNDLEVAHWKQDCWTAAEELMHHQYLESATVQQCVCRLCMSGSASFVPQRRRDCEDVFTPHFGIRHCGEVPTPHVGIWRNYTKALTEVFKLGLHIALERAVHSTVCFSCKIWLEVKHYPRGWNIAHLLDSSLHFHQYTITWKAFSLSHLRSDFTDEFHHHGGCILRNKTYLNHTSGIASESVNNSGCHFHNPDGKDFPYFPRQFKSFYNNTFISHHSNKQKNLGDISTAMYVMYNIYMLVMILAVLYKHRKDYMEKVNRSAVHHLNLCMKLKGHWNQKQWYQKSFTLKKLCVFFDSAQLSLSKQNLLSSIPKEFMFSPHLKSGKVRLHHENDSFIFTAIYVFPATRYLADPTFNPEIDLSHVAYRLATLGALPSSVPVSRVKLAEAGFYYRGQNDEVICYSCRVRHSDWSRGGRDLMALHRELSPHCEHVLARDREEAVLASGRSSGERRANAVVSDSGPAERHGAPAENYREASANAGSRVTVSFSSVQGAGAGSGGSSPITTATSRQPAGGQTRNLFPQPRLDLGQAVYPMYHDMAIRRRTFTSAWDESRAPPLDEVIHSGMFYAGYADCVRCFFCGVGLKRWVVTDNVWTEHIRWRPNCEFLRAIKGDNFISSMQRQLGISTAATGDAEQQALQQPSQAQNGENAASPVTPSCSSGSSQAVPAPAVVVTAASGSGGSVTSSTSSVVTPVVANSGGAPASGEEAGRPGARQAGSVAGTRSSPDRADQSGEGSRRGGDGERQGTDASADQNWLAQAQAENRELTRQFLCQACHQAPIDSILMPCGHLVVCSSCTSLLTACPLCQSAVHSSARVNMD